MKLKNWYICKAAKRSSSDGVALVVKSLDNTSVTLQGSGSSGVTQVTRLAQISTSAYYPATNGGCNVICGSGNTAPTIDDYCLETPFKTLGVVSSVYKQLVENDVIIGTSYIKTLTNNTGAEITINEVGVVTTNSSSTVNDSTSILVERTVLESPITVPDGATFTITFNELY